MPPLALPEGFDASRAPAHAIYSADETAALVWHPLGLSHENAVLAIARLQRKGVRVLNAPVAAEDPAT